MPTLASRNRGDFGDVSTRSGLSSAGPDVQRLMATDHDDDLDTDIIIVDSHGQFRLFDNRRHGRFKEIDRGLDRTPCQTILARDFDNDGYEDLVLVTHDGILHVQRNTGTGYAQPTTVPVKGILVKTICSLDIDNDGWLDIAAAGQQQSTTALVILRNQGDGTWRHQRVEQPPDGCLALDSADLDRDGDLDLLALDAYGRVLTWNNEGGNANHWLRVRLRGLQISGSKNNLHGIGCKVEVKSGASYQMQFARRDTIHFGLGNRVDADLLRVVWSNGVPQNRFHPEAEQTILEPQILKGSCPYLYCWDGSKFTFVTDTLAGAPLDLQVAEVITGTGKST